MKQLLIVSIIMLLLVTSASALTVRTLALDESDSSEINPATIALGGVSQIGTPQTEFLNIGTGIIYTITHAANGYDGDSDSLFFDSGLSSCTQGQTCTLNTNYQGTNIQTTCNWSSQNSDFECSAPLMGQTIEYIYNPNFNRVLFINFLAKSTGNPTFDDTKRYTIISQSRDEANDLPINPSTIDLGGVVKTGTPDATFEQVPSDTLYTITHEATNYNKDYDSVYFDHNLRSCTGAACSLSSKDEYGRVTNTVCSERLTGVYDCTATFDTEPLQFTLDLGQDTITVVNLLSTGNNNPNFDNTKKYLFRTFALNVTNLEEINPSTIDFAGVVRTATPTTEYVDVPSDTMFHITHSANNYHTDSDSVYFDHNLKTCTNQATCDMSSEDEYGNPQRTICNYNSQFQDYECLWYYDANLSDPRDFLWKPSENRVTFINLLDYDVGGNNNAPQIVASVTPLSGTAPLTATFAANITDENIASITWIYGDGAIEVIDDPNSIVTYTYQNPGNYTPTLVVFDEAGLSTTVSFNIEVLPTVGPNQPPTLVAVANPDNGGAPLTVTFSGTALDSDGSIENVTIDFGDGQISSPLPATFSTTHTYATGNYQAVVTAVDNDGVQVNQSIPITVSAVSNNPPTTIMNINPTSGSVPLTVTISGSASDSDGTVQSLVIDYGDGNQQALSNPFVVTHTYTQIGVFNVVLTATDDDAATGSSNGTVVVNSSQSQPPVVAATASPQNGVAPLSVNFAGAASDSDGNIVSLEIAFGDGYNQSLANPFNINHVYQNPGLYTAVVTALDNSGDSGSQQFVINVTGGSGSNNPPNVSLLANPSQGSTPLSVTFTGTASDSDGTVTSLVLDFGDGNQQSVTSPFSVSYTYSNQGVYTAVLSATDDDFDSASAQSIINVTGGAGSNNTAPVATLVASPTSGNGPLTVAFSGSAIDVDGSVDSLVLMFGDGSQVNVSNPFALTHTYTTTGNLIATLVATDDDSASGVDVQVIVVNNGTGGGQSPTITATASPQNGTAPLQVAFAGSANDPDGNIQSLVIDFGDGNSQSLTSPFSRLYTYSSPGVFTATITATDNNNNVATEQFTINVQGSTGLNLPPVVTLTASPLQGQMPLQVVFAGTATDSDGTVTSLVLDFGDGSSQTVSNTFAVSHTYSNMGAFNAVLTGVDDDGASTTDSDLITVFGNTACSNGIDDDNDGLIDLNDPGCYGSSDNDESNSPNPNGCNLETESNNNIYASGVKQLKTGQQACGFIDPNFDLDVWSLDCGSGDLVEISINTSAVNSSLDSYLELLSIGGTVVQTSNDVNGNDPLIRAVCPSPGAFARISGVGADVGQYTLLYNIISKGSGPRVRQPEPVTKQARVTIRSIRFDAPVNKLRAGDWVTAYVRFENTGEKKVRNLKVALVIPELNLRMAAGPMDLSTGQVRTEPFLIQIPAEGIEPGQYLVRMTLSSIDERRVVHRFVDIHPEPLEALEVEMIYR